MDFSLDDEQRSLRDMARSVLGKAYGDFEHRRQVTAKSPGFDTALWRELAELGLLGLNVSSEHGGSDATLVEVGIVLRELGRALAPEPYLTSAVIPAELVRRAGSEEQQAQLLPGLCAAELVMSWAHEEPGQQWGGSPSGVSATETSTGWTLSGVKEPVINGADADVLIVSATIPTGGAGVFVVRADARGLVRTGYHTPGAGHVATVELDQTPATPLGSPGRADEVIATASAIAQVLAGQEVVGAMQALLTMTTTYLTQRRQFGTTLNSFQALTFRAADLYVEQELTESLVDWATMVVAENSSGAIDAGTRVAAYIGRTARTAGQEAIQLHGGIGMTAEHPVSAYVQRLTALGQVIGPRTHHLNQLAAHVHAHGPLQPLG